MPGPTPAESFGWKVATFSNFVTLTENILISNFIISFTASVNTNIDVTLDLPAVAPMVIYLNTFAASSPSNLIAVVINENTPLFVPAGSDLVITSSPTVASIDGIITYKPLSDEEMQIYDYKTFSTSPMSIVSPIDLIKVNMLRASFGGGSAGFTFIALKNANFQNPINSLGYLINPNSSIDFAYESNTAPAQVVNESSPFTIVPTSNVGMNLFVGNPTEDTNVITRIDAETSAGLSWVASTRRFL